MTKPEETDDGYIVIQPIKPVENAIKGIKCGACGTKFDHGKAYGYSCHRIDCPVFPKVTC